MSALRGVGRRIAADLDVDRRDRPTAAELLIGLIGFVIVLLACSLQAVR